jgi:hypothetical protein
MAKSLTIRDADRNVQSGEITIFVGRSRELSFPDIKSMTDAFDEQSERDELLIGLLVAWARRQPNSTWKSCKGKTITIDIDAPDGVIVKVTNG